MLLLISMTNNTEQFRCRIRNKLHKRKTNNYDVVKRRNNKWSKYYQSRAWRQLREKKIFENPVCENCLHFGIVTPATEVHHLHAFGDGNTEEEKWRLLLDKRNLRSLCTRCHDMYHNQLVFNNLTSYYDFIKPKWILQ